MKMSVSSI